MNKKAIKAGILIDGTGRKPIKDIVVLIEDSKIVAVGEMSIPTDVEVIDASDKTVMPGLIDSHVHIHGFRAPKAESTLSKLETPPTLEILYAARNAKLTLEAGFTAVRDCALAKTTMVPLRDAIELGIVPGPRIVASGWVGMTAGHEDMLKPSFFCRSPQEVADGPWEVRKRVRELVREGVDVVKTATSGGGVGKAGTNLPHWRNYTMDELEALVDEAHAFDRKVAAHASGTIGIKMAIAAGVDTIEHGEYIDGEAIDMLIKKKTILVPTMGMIRTLCEWSISPEKVEVHVSDESLKRARERWEPMVTRLRKAYKAGVKIAMGTDTARILNHGENARELEVMVEYLGMSEMEAIVASTKTAAEALGRADQIGTIESGKLADIILVKGDPSKDITILQDKNNISMILKNGEIVVDR